jgi:hypothetical protein
MMNKLISALFVLLSLNCQAEEDFWVAGFEWIKSSLPEINQVDFNKSKIKFPGCKHQDYELMLSQSVTNSFKIETSMAYTKGQLTLGGYEKKITMAQWSIIPRFQLNEELSLGGGVIFQSVADFSGVQGEQFNLPKSRAMTFSARIESLGAKHSVELALTSKSWQATDAMGNWFERGETDNTLTLSYQGYF